MKEIQLTQGKTALVDDDDFARISESKWCYSEGYAVRNNGSRGYLKMHHEVIGKPPIGMVTDHINGNGTDNRRCNLRHVTQNQNLMNKRAQKNSKSGRKGVYWHKASQKWVAEIKAYGKRVRVGRFDDLDEAARAYSLASIKLHGEFGRASI